MKPFSHYFTGLSKRASTPIQYSIVHGGEQISLNELIGKQISFQWDGTIQCEGCQSIIKKTYQNGYCYLCFKSKAICDICILKPERCHYHLGTCREPSWGEQYCFQDHVVYLANSSTIKVGISRATNIPNRWIDQGACQGVLLLKCQDRLTSGLIEVELAKHMKDKSNWRKLITQHTDPVELREQHEKWQSYIRDWAEQQGIDNITWVDYEPVSIVYPVEEYPEKAKSIKLKPNEMFSSTLLGIKGQYLLFAEGGLNLRTHLALI